MDATLNILKQTISEARDEERAQAKMLCFIEDNLASLHSSIAISAKSPSKALMNFIEDYVDSVPDHIQALHALAEEAKIGEYVQPFLDLACTYFINPPDLLAPFPGLQGLLRKAYLAHRLMEELNDQIMSLSGGAALAPMDMSMANIIGHALIGDELSNQLDHLVLLTVETTGADKSIFEKRSVRKFLETRRLKGWQQVNERWPCFAKDCSINLQMSA